MNKNKIKNDISTFLQFKKGLKVKKIKKVKHKT